MGQQSPRSEYAAVQAYSHVVGYCEELALAASKEAISISQSDGRQVPGMCAVGQLDAQYAADLCAAYADVARYAAEAIASLKHHGTSLDLGAGRAAASAARALEIARFAASKPDPRNRE